MKVIHKLVLTAKILYKNTYSPEVVVQHAGCTSQTLEHQQNCET